MKKTMLTSFTLIISLFYLPNSLADENSVGLRICEYIKLNEKSRLKSFLQSEQIKIREIYDTLKCNNKNLLVFAAEQNALDSGNYIIGRISPEKVAASYQDIEKYSLKLAQAAQERIN